jgi:Transglycosylase SLT domain
MAARRRRSRLRTSRLRLLVGVLVGVTVLAAANWIYQLVRKPTEAFFPLDGVLAKTPAQTWREYGPLFRRHSTPTMTPELLAALAQAEGSGNPVARTYWRWRVSWNPGEVYRPASSAVGMYQITDARFAEAKRYCIRDHAASDSCWFNAFYFRVIPSHAIELTSAFLDRRAAQLLSQHRLAATLEQKQDLAAVIHLCGATVADGYARRGFRPASGERCGDHDLAAYLARLNQLKRWFVQMRA